jgi:hypothetical protein
MRFDTVSELFPQVALYKIDGHMQCNDDDGQCAYLLVYES